MGSRFVFLMKSHLIARDFASVELRLERAGLEPRVLEELSEVCKNFLKDYFFTLPSHLLAYPV